MKNINFNELEWHDAIIKNIIIDRGNAGNDDTIEMWIVWPSEKKSKIIFKDVYKADLSLNFGIVAEETIYNAFLIDDYDKEIIDIRKTWEKYYEEISKIRGFKILTTSTASTIKIFSLSYHIEELS